MRKWLFAVAAAALTAVGFAQPAAADAPTTRSFTSTDMGVVTGVCAFPVNVTSTSTIRESVFTDQSGRMTRVQWHVVERDVFTANGKTLAGLPYTFNLRVLFNPQTGEPTHVYAAGVVSRVPLPGGDVFLTAGRADFTAHPGASFLLQPDVGAQGNVAGFCAALAP